MRSSFSLVTKKQVSFISINWLLKNKNTHTCIRLPIVQFIRPKYEFYEENKKIIRSINIHGNSDYPSKGLERKCVCANVQIGGTVCEV